MTEHDFCGSKLIDVPTSSRHFSEDHHYKRLQDRLKSRQVTNGGKQIFFYELVHFITIYSHLMNLTINENE